MGALRAVRSVGPPGACIGSGATRNAVWDALHGYTTPSFLADVDVPYFDPNDLSEATEENYEERLKALRPEFTWDVKNQAAVHLWFHKVFGDRVEPLLSMRDAAATWPRRHWPSPSHYGPTTPSPLRPRWDWTICSRWWSGGTQGG